MSSVLVGMSGGVDSSVSAYLLQKAGYTVYGLSLIFWETRFNSGLNACCSVDSALDAAKTASMLGISHSAKDVRVEFMELVIEPFISSYKAGLTPNPCILCNRHVKFPVLLDVANQMGIDFIATGHYAIVENRRLKIASDHRKDQSYFLYAMTRETLNRLILPLGQMTKDDVREVARGLCLPAAARPESQEICFVEDCNYGKLIRDYEGGSIVREGPIVDMDGKRVGTHSGLYAYTLGQRRGIGVAAKEPLYVVGIDTTNNTLRVAPREYAAVSHCLAADINVLVDVGLPARLHVRSRSSGGNFPALVSRIDAQTLKVEYETPQWPAAPGQSVVFYDGDTVIGGGVIV
ncbi:MAG: tRNA 2-thiouridine(34) synthase MnmA [Candidatus Magnetominusculus sp. LBB02]|nr:tRNA 2-thiouridine(34) synthase MnmA [Candidatus Magnetominusculus sp. LBB02]